MSQTSSLPTQLGAGDRGLRGEFCVSTKGKPFSLKKKKEQTRAVGSQTTGRNLCPSPAAPGLRKHLASQPHVRFSQGGCSRGLWGNGQPKAGARKGPQPGAPIPPWANGLEVPPQLQCREQQTASPALVQQGRRWQTQISPLNPPK